MDLARRIVLTPKSMKVMMLDVSPMMVAGSAMFGLGPAD